MTVDELGRRIRRLCVAFLVALSLAVATVTLAAVEDAPAWAVAGFAALAALAAVGALAALNHAQAWADSRGRCPHCDTGRPDRPERKEGSAP